MTAYIALILLLFNTLDMFKCLPSHSFSAAFHQPFFTDKSEMLRILFEHNTTATGSPHHYYITAPCRFGKNVNLDMVHAFAAVDLDHLGEARSPKDTSAYHIFAKLNIAKYPSIISEHLARYPVIHLDMMGIAFPETTTEQLVTDLNTILWYELQQYPQLKNLRDHPNKFELNEHETTFLKNLQDKKLDISELESSLLNFARVLYVVYQKPVLLLLNEYDETAFESYVTMKSYVVTIYRHLNEMVTRALTLGRPYIKLAIINAITTLPYDIDHSLRAATTHYAFLDDHLFTPFYGYTDSELDHLFHKYNCNETERKSMRDYYRGYRTARNQTILYNSMSVAFYFKDRSSRLAGPNRFANYFKNCNHADRLSLFTRDDLFRNMIETLIRNGSINTEIKKMHGNEALRNLELLRDRRWLGTLPQHLDIFLTQCFEMGYFSHGIEHGVFVVPNRELKENIELNIDTYYRLYASSSTTKASI